MPDAVDRETVLEVLVAPAQGEEYTRTTGEAGLCWRLWGWSHVLDAPYVGIWMRRGRDVCAVFSLVGPPAGITRGPFDGHATGILGMEEWIVLC